MSSKNKKLSTIKKQTERKKERDQKSKRKKSLFIRIEYRLRFGDPKKRNCVTSESQIHKEEDLRMTDKVCPGPSNCFFNKTCGFISLTC